MEKKFDKEYATQWALEYMYLLDRGIRPTYKKIDRNGITIWKYKKDYRLFDTLKNFYKSM